jgi:predicted O-linked N-acetylglucosamine transferase (SPINDLY family)
LQRNLAACATIRCAIPIANYLQAAMEQLIESAHALHLEASLERSEANEETIAAYQALLRRALDLGQTCCDRGEAMIRQERLEDGLACLALAEELKADVALLHDRLGDAHLRLFQFDEAISAYRSAARLQPDNEPAARKLADAIEKQKRPEHVLAACRTQVERTHGSAAARLQLANALREFRQLDEAIEEYQRVIELQPDSAAARNNLAIALKDVGRVEESLGVLREAVQIEPRSFTIGSNLLYGMYFHPGDDAGAILEEHVKFDQRLTRPLTLVASPHSNDRFPDRVLRIGYVSPNFREHCQSFFTIPLLSNHDRERFEIFCYSDVSRPDALTDRLQSYSHAWRETLGRSDQRVAELVRGDRIDILVDLTMHMSRSRAGMFARKPAPVQITWLAYPGTTGLSAMDYRLSDPYLDPPGQNDADYSEKTVRLPETFWCYDPLREAVPISPLPAIGNGLVTFGCLNNFCKVTDETLGMWKQVLHGVHNSRVILLAPTGNARRHALRALDIDDSRIEFLDYLPRPEYLENYNRMDICLDTFPYNGHTTSLDALWMGVPVISRCGRTAVARAGFSQATNLGLTDLIAETSEAFAGAAIALARNLARLSQFRGTLRDRMRASPLMDATRFARKVEWAYRMLWYEWCFQHR